MRGEQKNKKTLKNIAEEVETMLTGMNPDELEQLEEECRQNLSGDLDVVVDVEYWEEVSRLCEVIHFQIKYQIRLHTVKTNRAGGK